MATTSKPKPRPVRKTSFAFFLERCRTEFEAEHGGEAPDDFVAWTKDVTRRWESMPHKEQRFYHQLKRQHQDHELNSNEIRSNTISCYHGKKRKLLIGDSEPIHTLPAFHFFYKDNRDNVLGKNPSFSEGEVAIALGRMWIEADMEVKDRYWTKAKEDETRYQKEVTEFKKKNPWSSVGFSSPDTSEGRINYILV